MFTPPTHRAGRGEATESGADPCCLAVRTHTWHAQRSLPATGEGLRALGGRAGSSGGRSRRRSAGSDERAMSDFGASPTGDFFALGDKADHRWPCCVEGGWSYTVPICKEDCRSCLRDDLIAPVLNVAETPARPPGVAQRRLPLRTKLGELPQKYPLHHVKVTVQFWTHKVGGSWGTHCEDKVATSARFPNQEVSALVKQVQIGCHASAT